MSDVQAYSPADTDLAPSVAAASIELTDAQRIRERILARREQSREQRDAEAEDNMVRAGLCTDNREYKAAIPGLENAICALEFTSPALHAYIRKMELAEFQRVAPGVVELPQQPSRDEPMPTQTTSTTPVQQCQRAELISSIEGTLKSLREILDRCSEVATPTWTGMETAASAAPVVTPPPQPVTRTVHRPSTVNVPRPDFAEKIKSMLTDAGDLW